MYKCFLVCLEAIYWTLNKFSIQFNCKLVKSSVNGAYYATSPTDSKEIKVKDSYEEEIQGNKIERHVWGRDPKEIKLKDTYEEEIQRK